MVKSLALELKSVHKQIDGTAIVRGVDLALQAGQRLALIGPNGAGKTTLFNLISGVLAPTAGEIWLNGQRIDGKPPHHIYRLGLSRSFQISQLFAKLSVWDNLRCALLWQAGCGYTPFKWLARMDAVNTRVQALIERLGLAHLSDVRAQDLGYAEQRALDVGMALASDAPVLLLDEPTAGMSTSQAQHFVQWLGEVTAGKTLLLVEHDMSVAFGLADQVAVLVAGQVLALGSPDQVRASAQVQQAYLGDPLSPDPSSAR